MNSLFLQSGQGGQHHSLFNYTDPDASFYSGFSDPNSGLFGDMLIQSQDINMNLLGGLDSLPWFDYPHSDMMMFDPGGNEPIANMAGQQMNGQTPNQSGQGQ